MKMLLHLRPTCSNILATKVTLFSLYQTFLPFFYIDVTFAGVNRRDVFVPIAGRALHSPRRPAPCGRTALHSPRRPAPCGRAALHSPGQGVPWRAPSLRVRRSLHVAGRWTARGARSFTHRLSELSHSRTEFSHSRTELYTHGQFSVDCTGRQELSHRLSELSHSRTELYTWAVFV